MDTQQEPVSNEITLGFIGDSAVGKTSLINSYAMDTFDEAYSPSVLNQFKIEVDVTHPIYKKQF